MIAKSSQTTPSKSNVAPTFNSLADLTAHHLKISSSSEKGKTSNDSNSMSPLGFVIPKFSMKFGNKNLLKDKALDDVNKEISSLKIEDKKPCIEKIKNNVKLDDVNSKVPNIKLEYQNSVDSEFKKNFCEMEFEKIVHIKKEKNIEVPNIKTEILDENIDTLQNLISKKLYKDNCVLFSNKKIDDMKLVKKPISLFGKVLCKKWQRCTPYKRTINSNLSSNKSDILRFDFSSPSPDSKILARVLLCKEK